MEPVDDTQTIDIEENIKIKIHSPKIPVSEPSTSPHSKEIVEVDTDRSTSRNKKKKIPELATQELEIYTSINDFVTDIFEFLQEKKISIQSIINYYNLLKQTTVSHRKSVRAHIAIFEKFINNNTKFIETGKLSKLIPDYSVILYSENVFINIRELMSNCDMSSKKTVMDHIKHIKNKIHPPIQRNSMTKNADLNGMFKLIEGSIDKNETNPMNAIMKIMGSSAFPQLVGMVQKSAQEGKLNDIIASLGASGMGM